MTCPDPTTIERFVGRALPPHELMEVERHLAICDDCVDLVAAVAGTTGDGSAGSSTQQEGAPAIGASLGATLPAGTFLGRYEVRRWLGRGGMGDVYEGFDRHLERRIALKILHDGGREGGGDQEVARQRLGREAKSLARLSHPNVVTVHDVGLDGDQLFLVMELVEGPTLATWLRAAPRTWRQILDVFLDAGEGLAAAHDVGVIHRDFKPQNVLIGADGKARVSDFGLARSGGGASRGEVSSNGNGAPSGDGPESLTESGAVIGTPRYMAPEQTLGHRIDARADQFSFAVALYEGLYGKHPFAPDKTRQAAPITDKALGLPKNAITANRPTVPETPGRRVPRRIAAILERGLASEPQLRFESMRPLLDALRTRTKGRRRVALAVALLIACAVLLVGTSQIETQRSSTTLLSPVGKPMNWDNARAFFRVAGRIHCVDKRKDGRLRVVWGNPRRVDDVDIVTGIRSPADLVPRSYRHGCPALSPDEQKLIYEGFDEAGRPKIFYAPNPRGDGAEPIVSTGTPAVRSEPAWFPSSNEFIFDMDQDHPAIFSLRDNSFLILPDEGRHDRAGRGFARIVSPDGRRIAVLQNAEASWGIYVLLWPSLSLESGVRLPYTAGYNWRFAADSRRLFGWLTASRDQLVLLDPMGQQLVVTAQVSDRDVFEYVQVGSSEGVLTTRRIESHVWYLDPNGKQHVVPSIDFAWDLSPSRTADGNIMFIRNEGDKGSRARLFHPIDGRLETISAGPMDWAVSSLPDGTFLLSRNSSDGLVEIARCAKAADGSHPACTQVARAIMGPVVASPNGRFAAYEQAHGLASIVSVLALGTGTAIDLTKKGAGCQTVWSSGATIWVVERTGDGYQWTEFEAATGIPTGKTAPTHTGCIFGEPNPDPPVSPRVWRVVTPDYDLRLVRE